MKNKHLVILVLVAIVLTACVAEPPVTPVISQLNGLMELPTEGRTLIAVLFSALATALALKVPFLAQFKDAIIATVVPILITLIESWLGTFAPIYDNIILAIIHVIVVGIGSLGALLAYRRARGVRNLFVG